MKLAAVGPVLRCEAHLLFLCRVRSMWIYAPTVKITFFSKQYNYGF
jgi:hypothetical protein